MNILALEPYFGGSHRAFLDGWVEASSHQWTCLTLPAHHWKWRMRHGAITFAEQVGDLTDTSFDLLFCSDMLNLAAFRGLAPRHVAQLPAVIYFHENQLTYPDELRSERDFHYAFDNFQSMLAADSVWFNSAFHRDEFYSSFRTFLKCFPDYTLERELEESSKRVMVAAPGLPDIHSRSHDHNFDEPHILWAARWEKDKNPDDFFAALVRLKNSGQRFRLSVAGESFHDSPSIFTTGRDQLRDHIVHWGYLASQEEYVQLLLNTDIFVATAIHEFFGISAAEAILAGNIPVLPNRLAYPELVHMNSHLLYDGTTDGLLRHLTQLIHEPEFQRTAESQSQSVQDELTKLRWSALAPQYDQLLEDVDRKK